jgi:radical SAM superfamily enzyme YgiQ (UPF0313 family)
MDKKITFAFWPLYVHWSNAVAQLSAVCKKRGIEVDVVMLDAYPDPADFAPGSDLVGFSCVTAHDYRKCIPYMRRAKKLGKTVLLGGVWASLGHEVDCCVDLVCRGDGEGLPDFILEGDETIFQKACVTKDLNAIPLMDYGLPMVFDRLVPPFGTDPALIYVSSRGCPNCCIFCQIQWQHPGQRIRTTVAKDLRKLTKIHKPAGIYFGDALLPYGSKAWRDSWGDFRYPFTGYIRADIQPAELEWLIDRGMMGCAFGIETGDEWYRNQILAKGITDAQIYETVKRLKTHNIWFMSFFMAGLPSETWTMLTRSAKMIRAIGGETAIWKYEDLAIAE